MTLFTFVVLATQMIHIAVLIGSSVLPSCFMLGMDDQAQRPARVLGGQKSG